MKGLPDYLEKNLKVIFIGYNPSIKSGEVGHHYAGRNNRFWRLLYEAGLTPRLFNPEEDYKLLELGMGLTNIVERPTKKAADLTAEDYARGRKRLYSVLATYKPLVACYVGIGVYKAFSKNKTAKLGLQANSIVKGVLDFAAPSSSGLNRMLYKEQLKYYRELAAIIIKNKDC